MADPPSVRIIPCPSCGSQVGEKDVACPACGTDLELAGAGSRATLPSHSRMLEAQARALSERPGPVSDSGRVDAEGISLPDAGPSPDSLRPSRPESDEGPVRSQDLSMADGEWKMVDDGESDGGPDPLIGLVIAGRYRIVECIGRGGMGVVYRVEHTEIGKLLALKLLAGELSRQKEVVRRFKREALLASRLTHPNSVQVFDFGVSEGLTYLVMELVVGRDLSRLIKPEPMSSTRLAKIIVQVCSSLAEAHAMGIVHRDIKPENIIVAKTRDGGDFAKVLDFGLAKLREAPELNAVTGTGQVVGTPFYMAPEQIHGKPVDGRADIYALGAVMYEALTGEPVFRGSSPMAVFTKHLTERPIPVRKRRPTRLIPPAMEEIVMRCLAKEVEDRYQRVEDLQAALIDHLGGLGQSGIEALLNSTRLQALQADLIASDGSRSQGMSRTLLHAEVATRDEVTAFKRKLARQRWVSASVAVLLSVGALYGGLRAYHKATEKPPFAGLEQEPNDQAPEANEVPLGRSVRGLIGKRIDVERGDRDFYRMLVPPGSGVISVTLTGLPNMATCLWVYREGDVDPLGRYCTAMPGKTLSMSALRLEPGGYLFAVMQDRNPYEGHDSRFVIENVSDAYELTVSAASIDASMEVEPNDAESAATPVPVGGTTAGRFDWVGDVDYVCAWPRDGGQSVRARFRVTDAEDRTRDRGAVLELVQVREGEGGVPLRVHREGAKRPPEPSPSKKDRKAPTNKKPAPEPVQTDIVAPWTSEPFELSSGKSQCVRLRLTGDPWAGTDAPLTPPVSPERWKVHVEQVD